LACRWLRGISAPRQPDHRAEPAEPRELTARYRELPSAERGFLAAKRRERIGPEPAPSSAGAVIAEAA
jgi:hypothetical protein